MVFFSFLAVFAKVTGTGNAWSSIFLVTFGILFFFSLPIGAIFDFSKKWTKLRYLGYALIFFAIILWVGALSHEIGEKASDPMPIKIRGLNIVKEGPYAEYVSAYSIPPLTAQYGEFSLDISVVYFRPIMGPESVELQEISVLTNGFELKDVKPSLPFRVGDSTLTFTLTLKGPQEGFEGPITLKISLS
ncbi:MAG: hypothetical protein NZ872_02310 [Archaeoglobaceae archaeon]|nr:hypothetical protein [Archaeoglobaceae archaeon]MDW8128032.1 hypothetical protein [Archaeoglobaceae archaeon]